MKLGVFIEKFRFFLSKSLLMSAFFGNILYLRQIPQSEKGVTDHDLGTKHWKLFKKNPGGRAF